MGTTPLLHHFEISIGCNAKFSIFAFCYGKKGRSGVNDTIRLPDSENRG